MLSERRPLREWQTRALQNWENAGRTGIVAVVTGAGKTLFALTCIDRYRRTVPAATVLIVVPTAALQEQWLDEITSFFDIPVEQVVLLTGRRRIRLSQINLAVINTASQLEVNEETPPVFLVVDECHRAASESFRNIFRIPADATLGLSATPERQYDDGFETILVPALGPVIERYSYADALRDGVIVPFSVRNIVFEFDAEEQAQYDKLTKSIRLAIDRHGVESEEAVRLLLRRSRLSNLSLTRIRLAATLVGQNRGKKILLFHEDTEACDLLTQILNEHKLAAAVYHSKIPMSRRLAALADYRSGRAKVLVTCRALDEGFNAPETEVGIVAAATATYRRRIQRLGRILRPASNKESAVIYSIVASPPEIRRLADEAEDLEGIAEVTWTRV